MSKRDQLIVLCVAGAAALAAFYIGLLKPELAKSNQLGTQLAAAQARRATAVASVASARAAEAAYQPNLAAINASQTAIPPTDKTSSLLDQLDGAARLSGVDFSTITLSSSGGSPTPTPAPAPTAGGSSAGGSAAASPSTSTASSPAAAGATAGTTALSVPPGYSATGAAGLPTVTYALQFDGNYLNLQKFLAAMQHFVAIRNGEIRAHGRLITVQGISVSQGKVSMTVVAYLLSPADQAPLPVPRAAAASVPAVSTSPANPKAASATAASRVAAVPSRTG